MCGVSRCELAWCTWGELHRMECEARYVLKLDKPKRVDHYIAVSKIRGLDAATQLKQEVRRQWELMRQLTA